ncbi:MAG: peptidylprolyl isomerase [Clostridia bacterium]|nr:peptidylprolyl isomerase [Clostridia bacterium]
MKKLLLIFLTIILVVAMTSCAKESDAGLTEESYTIEIEIENYGTITAVLDAKTAPITVENFLKYVKEGYYNGLTFHRIIEGFMMQGGDKNGDGINNEGTPTIKGEFYYNNVPNDISHTRGTLSMARSSSYNSASTQFFIMHQDYTSLDGQYAAFGRVTKGIEIVDEICETAVVVDNNGSVPEGYRPVIKEIRIVE